MLHKLIPFLAGCLALFIVSNASAQQDARYSQYMFNSMLINPGYTGSTGGTAIDILGRYQWVNIEGSPKTLSLSAHAPIGSAEKIGIGGFVEADVIGVHTRIRAYATYAYRFQVGRGHLAAGIQAGILGLRSEFSRIQSSSELGQIDPIYQIDENSILPNFGLGLYYHTPRFYAGVSVPHLLENKYYKTDGGVTKLSQEERHYIATIGGVIPLGENLKFRPSALFKTVPGQAPSQFDANLSFLIRETIWLGSSLRFTEQFKAESLDFIIGLNIGNGGIGKIGAGRGMRISYAYDISLNHLRYKNAGSHELMLGIDLGGKAQRYKTPRYF